MAQAWATDLQWCRAAEITDERGFAAEIEQARQIVSRGFATGLPSRWVTPDEVYDRYPHISLAVLTHDPVDSVWGRERGAGP